MEQINTNYNENEIETVNRNGEQEQQNTQIEQEDRNVRTQINQINVNNQNNQNVLNNQIQNPSINQMQNLLNNQNTNNNRNPPLPFIPTIPRTEQTTNTHTTPMSNNNNTTPQSNYGPFKHNYINTPHHNQNNHLHNNYHTPFQTSINNRLFARNESRFVQNQSPNQETYPTTNSNLTVSDQIYQAKLMESATRQVNEIFEISSEIKSKYVIWWCLINASKEFHKSYLTNSAILSRIAKGDREMVITILFQNHGTIINDIPFVALKDILDVYFVDHTTKARYNLELNNMKFNPSLNINQYSIKYTGLAINAGVSGDQLVDRYKSSFVEYVDHYKMKMASTIQEVNAVVKEIVLNP